jgi:hypothetical protein
MIYDLLHFFGLHYHVQRVRLRNNYNIGLVGARCIAPVVAVVNSTDIDHPDDGRDTSGPYDDDGQHPHLCE